MERKEKIEDAESEEERDTLMCENVMTNISILMECAFAAPSPTPKPNHLLSAAEEVGNQHAGVKRCLQNIRCIRRLQQMGRGSHMNVCQVAGKQLTAELGSLLLGTLIADPSAQISFLP